MYEKLENTFTMQKKKFIFFYFFIFEINAKNFLNNSVNKGQKWL